MRKRFFGKMFEIDEELLYNNYFASIDFFNDYTNRFKKLANRFGNKKGAIILKSDGYIYMRNKTVSKWFFNTGNFIIPYIWAPCLFDIEKCENLLNEIRKNIAFLYSEFDSIIDDIKSIGVVATIRNGKVIIIEVDPMGSVRTYGVEGCENFHGKMHSEMADEYLWLEGMIVDLHDLCSGLERRMKKLCAEYIRKNVDKDIVSVELVINERIYIFNRKFNSSEYWNAKYIPDTHSQRMEV